VPLGALVTVRRCRRGWLRSVLELTVEAAEISTRASSQAIRWLSSYLVIRFPPWETGAVDELTVLMLRAKGGSRAALDRFVSETRPDV
jgi:hypothetical protein